jgi:hypothetical protein
MFSTARVEPEFSRFQNFYKIKSKNKKMKSRSDEVKK